MILCNPDYDKVKDKLLSIVAGLAVESEDRAKFYKKRGDKNLFYVYVGKFHAYSNIAGILASIEYQLAEVETGD